MVRRSKNKSITLKQNKNNIFRFSAISVFVIFSFFIVFQLSEKIFNNKTLSFLSVILLEGIYFYNFTTPEFNVNVCQLPFWSLTVFYAWKIFDGKT